MRSVLILIALLCAVSAQALPLPEEDALDTLLAQKGLLQQTESLPAKTAADLVVTAYGALGIPYRLGGGSYESGFDCSGFVRAVYGQALDLLLPRRADQQAAATQKINRSDLRPGDLVFFNTLRRAFSHVGIYVGDNKFIHSPRPGAAVRIEDLHASYWNRRFDGARRVIP